MARKRKKRRSPNDPLIDEVDRFLEKGVDAVSPSLRRGSGEKERPTAESPAEKEPPPPPSPAPSSSAEEPATREPTPSELELTLVEDGLKAIIRAVYPTTSSTDILDLLERSGITFGIDKKEILQAVETARQTRLILSDVVVAQGKPPVIPPPPGIEYRPPADSDSLPLLDPLRKLLALHEREELLREATTLRGWTVRPGDVLAVRVVSPGKAGTDVEGQPIPVSEDIHEKTKDPRLQPGDGVQLAPNGTDYVASIYGYAGLENNRVSVLDPLWLSADALEACFLKLSPLSSSKAPSSEDLDTLLEGFGVTAGIDAEAVDRLSRSFDRIGETLITLASGRPSQPPKNALPTLPLDYEFRIGTYRPDGSIDFKERNIFPAVHADDLLAECRQPTPGEPGLTVHGEPLPVEAPVDIQLIAGENVRAESADGIQRLFADADGGASLKTQTIRDVNGAIQSRQYTLSIQPVAHIEGDVDFAIGNIDFQGHVEIGGSVQGGFQVRAAGDIAISGSVEAGAGIEAGGDIAVKQGIVGRETTVRSRGSISAKFVHDARIQADADILLGSYARGAHLVAGDQVRVEGLGGSGNSGGIVGGRTWAKRSIVSRNLGSERSTSTHLFVGLEPEQHRRLEKLSETIRQAELMMQKLLRAIDLPALKAVEIRKRVARNPASKATVLHYVKKANQLAQIREKLLKEREELAAQIDATAAEAQIEIADRAFARTVLNIGDQQISLAQDLQRVLFRLDPETDRIAWQDLS